MKSLAIILVAVTATLSLNTSATSAVNARRLSGHEIRGKLAGMQLTGEVHWRDVYDRDGTPRSYADGKVRVGASS